MAIIHIFLRRIGIKQVYAFFIHQLLSVMEDEIEPDKFYQVVDIQNPKNKKKRLKKVSQKKKKKKKKKKKEIDNNKKKKKQKSIFKISLIM